MYKFIVTTEKLILEALSGHLMTKLSRARRNLREVRGMHCIKTQIRSLLLIVIAFLSIAHCVRAGEPQRLTGTYTLTPRSITDPKDDEKRDTHIRFYITGKAAADFYRSLPGKSKRDECFDDGTQTKAQGDFLCAKSPKGTHECWFGVDIRSQKLSPGFVC